MLTEDLLSYIYIVHVVDKFETFFEIEGIMIQLIQQENNKQQQGYRRRKKIVKITAHLHQPQQSLSTPHPSNQQHQQKALQWPSLSGSAQAAVHPVTRP